MIISAILLFVLAIAIGLRLIYLGMRYHRGSLAMGLGHAAIALSALVLLVLFILQEHITYRHYNEAAILFFIAMTGGVFLLALREERKPPPMLVVGAHAAIALIGLLLLVQGYFHR